ncbi:MAG: archease [Anaerolineales bacterium]|uniref:Archease n=1 Tax=Candidatus Desulfolinea nitratireducens TaxID=2841698 RepID=A0A8J6TDV2_9CHLR|nr:archease [Candidatus Desulfolinea nitratireducens]MBL6959969.1 archease [Anaerolineales bacterium]
MPFEEISHTADWSLRVWADDLAGLLTESARGMYALANAEPAESPRVKREISLDAVDAESLLVAFLEELLYLAESENLIFNPIGKMKIDGYQLKVELEGGAITSIDKEIKAVTFHNLKIRQSARGLEVEIVFDV